MSVVMSIDGPAWRCDGCLQIITSDGLVLHRPLTGQALLEVLTVHRGCTNESLVRALLPQYNSRPLTVVMNQLSDTLV
jgi:hydroxyacyl-ACP dehydratase HTD2-like protein with hotdog domain